jgi:acyl-CoA thioesterase II
VSVDRLLYLLDLEPIERNLFRGANPGSGSGRVFGGQVASQALRAAHHTVEADHHVHSLHSYFLRPGRFGMPILYSVDRIRDGRSFTTRRVTAIQQGEAIFALESSFQKAEDGPEYELPPPAGVPRPEDVPLREHWGPHSAPIESREMELPEPDDENRSTRRIWFRAAGPLPDDDPGLHACVITYASDMGPVGAARRPHRGQELMAASLDHVLWFHRQVRADEWLLYDLAAVATAGARGLARGTIHTSDGHLAVSVTQESLLRPVRR